MPIIEDANELKFEYELEGKAIKMIRDSDLLSLTKWTKEWLNKMFGDY